MKFRPGAENPRYRGGEWVSSKGYVMVWVGKDHPCARCRAYAPRYLLAFWETHGRLPRPGYSLHHIDEDKQHDAPTNLEERLIADHSRHHGRQRMTSEKAREMGRRGGQESAKARMIRRERFAASQRASARYRELARTRAANA